MRVSCRQHGPVVRIGLGPGESGRTLIDAAGVSALRGALDQAESTRARVLVLEGSEAGFCEGLDLAALLDAGGDPASAVHDFADCLLRLRRARALVISSVDGPCAGGGVGLAAAADLLICSSRASFVLPELALGLLPALVLPLLLARMPPQKARRLALSGSLDAGEALALGLADQLVEDEARLEAALRGLIKRGLRCHPAALSELKELCGAMENRSVSEGLELGAESSGRLLGDRERQGGLRAFLEGEPLPWFERYTESEKKR